MKKFNRQEMSQVARAMNRPHLEQSEHCEKCQTIVDISELNLVTGICSTCNRGSKVSNDFKKKMADAIIIADEYVKNLKKRKA